MPEVASRGFMKVIVHAEHRNGICVECGSKMEVRDFAKDNEGILSPILEIAHNTAKVICYDLILKRAVCPKCGSMKGQLIARPISIQAPDPPSCISFRCLWKFIMDSLYSAMLSAYHRRRVAYAEANRPEKKRILDRYRTGEKAPTGLITAIIANMKLTCPLCRRIETKW